MFGAHFYHAILRKTVTVFGTLFNNITIVRRSGNGNVEGNVVDVQKVPLAYGPKQKFLSRLEDQNDLEGTKVALKLPRMSFEITGMTYDSSTKLNALNKINVSETGSNRSSVELNVPYVLDVELNILAKNQDDALQITEQILPFFHPSYTVSVKYLDNQDKKFDVPITLNSVTMTDDYEGDFTTRRVIIYTLAFSMKIRFFSEINTSSIIREVNANFYQMDPNRFLESLATTVYPTGATKETAQEPRLEFRLIPSDSRTTLVDAASDANSPIDFTLGGIAYGDVSGTQGTIIDFYYDCIAHQNVIVLDNADGYFTKGENIIDASTGNTFNISEIEVVID